MPQTRNWRAFFNTGQRPFELYVLGQVEVGNPGVQVTLTEATPQGINPDILILDLDLVQLPGVWPQVLTWKNAALIKLYETDQRPGQVDIRFDGEIIASARVVVIP